MPEQLETAVYTNLRGEIVIRQRDDSGDDTFIYVLRENADRIAMAIEKEAERPFERSEDADDNIGPPIEGDTAPKNDAPPENITKQLELI